jgi:hypothetical protein
VPKNRESRIANRELKTANRKLKGATNEPRPAGSRFRRVPRNRELKSGYDAHTGLDFWWPWADLFQAFGLKTLAEH